MKDQEAGIGEHGEEEHGIWREMGIDPFVAKGYVLEVCMGAEREGEGKRCQDLPLMADCVVV